MVRAVLCSAVGFLIDIQQPDIAEPLAVGQGRRDLGVGGDRQRSLCAVISAVGHTELIVAGDDLDAAGAGGNIAIDIRKGEDRCLHRIAVLGCCGGDGVFRAVQQLSVVCNGVVESVQQRGGRLRGGGTQALQCRCVGIGRCRIILHMVGHVQVIRHLDNQLDSCVRISRRYMEAKGLDGRSRSVQLIATLVIIEQVIGGNAVDLIDESVFQADKVNI